MSAPPAATPRANMGTAVSKRKTLRNEAMSSVAAKVRAARAFGEYLSQNHPEGRNGSDHLLADSYMGQEDSPEMQQAAQNKRRLSVISDGKFERSFTEEQAEKMPSEGPKPRVYTISGERPMLSEHENDSMELVVMKGAAHEECHHGHHAHGAGGSHGGRHCKAWPGGRQGSKECPNCTRLAAPSQQSIELEQHPPGEAGWHRKRLERMYSVDRVSDDVPIRTWFPKENLFSFHTATTTMQANFRKHLRMVGSRRVKAQTFAERRERSFSRSWSDPTPIKADSFHDSRERRNASIFPLYSYKGNGCFTQILLQACRQELGGYEFAHVEVNFTNEMT